MKCVVHCLFAFVALAILAFMLPPAALAVDVPADRVLVLYFHRTQRCPTCLKMGSYSGGSCQERVCSRDQGRQGRFPLHRLPG